MEYSSGKLSLFLNPPSLCHWNAGLACLAHSQSRHGHVQLSLLRRSDQISPPTHTLSHTHTHIWVNPPNHLKLPRGHMLTPFHSEATGRCHHFTLKQSWPLKPLAWASLQGAGLSWRGQPSLAALAHWQAASSCCGSRVECHRGQREAWWWRPPASQAEDNHPATLEQPHHSTALCFTTVTVRHTARS